MRIFGGDLFSIVKFLYLHLRGKYDSYNLHVKVTFQLPIYVPCDGIATRATQAVLYAEYSKRWIANGKLYTCQPDTDTN